MLVNNVPRAITIRPSPKKPKKQRKPSPPEIDALATDAEEASTQVRCDDMLDLQSLYLDWKRQSYWS